MSNEAPKIIFEDNHLLVVDKPAGMLAQGDRTGDRTLLDVCRQDLKERYAKPGNVYLGLVHRLDRPVSGVMLLAKTSKAAGRMSKQFREGTVQKTYLAVVSGEPSPEAGELRHWLGAKGGRDGRTPVLSESNPMARESVLSYRVIESTGDESLVEVRPLTGRRHQIRAQLAAAGHPILGDVKYGSASRLPERRIALHAMRLEASHPISGDPMVFEVEPLTGWPWPRQ